MIDTEKPSPKERIFNAAVTLFALKGYTAVGVREIAETGEVNISMISYYFSGKIGILKAIFERFYKEYLEVLRDAINPELPVNEQTRNLVRNIVCFMRSRPDLCKIGITEIPYDAPEIAKFKSERVLPVKELIFDCFFRNSGLIIDDKITISIVSPSLISVIYSHFLLGDVIKKVMDIEFDDAYYERYVDTITTFLIAGILGVVAELQNKKTGEING
ncbi:MAG: TetR family transcriptional regulator [Candidatus Hatepunaea meridiana]|nr:TetR family transcriptional regulator [Candidatus Hatepunaea meridiana]